MKLPMNVFSMFGMVMLCIILLIRVYRELIESKDLNKPIAMSSVQCVGFLG